MDDKIASTANPRKEISLGNSLRQVTNEVALIDKQEKATSEKATSPGNLKPVTRSKTRFLNRYAAFEAAEVEPTATASNNIYDNLDDEGTSSAEEDDEEEYSYAEVERGIDRGHFPHNINKRDRNAVFRRTRKTQIQQGQVQPKERSSDSFTLKEKRQQRELARYVYYHQRFCHANPQAIALLHTACHIKKIVIPDKIPLFETCARQKIRKNQSKMLTPDAT